MGVFVHAQGNSNPTAIENDFFFFETNYFFSECRVVVFDWSIPSHNFIIQR